MDWSRNSIAAVKLDTNINLCKSSGCCSDIDFPVLVPCIAEICIEMSVDVVWFVVAFPRATTYLDGRTPDRRSIRTGDDDGKDGDWKSILDRLRIPDCIQSFI